MNKITRNVAADCARRPNFAVTGLVRNGGDLSLRVGDGYAPRQALPQLAPFFLAAARSVLALVWKIMPWSSRCSGAQMVSGYQLHIAFSNADVKTIPGLRQSASSSSCRRSSFLVLKPIECAPSTVAAMNGPGKIVGTVPHRGWRKGLFIHPLQAEQARRVLFTTSSSISRRAHLSSCDRAIRLREINYSRHRGRARHRFRWPNRSLARAVSQPRFCLSDAAPVPSQTIEENIALVLPDGDARADRIPELLASVSLSGIGPPT